jgi:transposase
MKSLLDRFIHFVYYVMMSFNKTKALTLEQKVKAVKRYINTEASLRRIAQDLGISHPTLWHWVQRYAKEGHQGLQRGRRQSKGHEKDIEHEIILLKEQDPGLSVRKAAAIMKKRGVSASTFRIWRIWKARGIASRITDNPLELFVPPTPELTHAMKAAQQCVGKKEYRRAAGILNNFPSILKNHFLTQIPEKYLSVRRRLDRLILEDREVSFEHYARKAKQIGAALEKEGYLYSSIIANFLELDALDIIGRPEKKAGVLKNLSKKMRGVKHYSLRFLLYFEQVYTSVYLLQITRALQYLRKCRRLMYLLPFPYYWEIIGGLLVSVGKFKNAGRFYEMAIAREKKSEAAGRIALQIARYTYCYAGEYSKCRKMLAKIQVKKDRLVLGSSYSLTNAYMCFGEGNLIDAARYYMETLEKAERGQHCNRIYATSVGLAGLSMALNKRADAMVYLKKYLSLMKKNKLRREELLLKCFLDPKTKISHELMQTSPFCLLHLIKTAHHTLKTGDYRKAFNFAVKHGLLGLFHRWIMLFPAPVLRLLKRGKPTYLPKALLDFPLFNQEVPVYHIKFLGSVIVTRNQRRLNARLTPKEKTFLIHFALRAGEPGRHITTSEIFRNFWPRSKDPASLLLHLLTSIRRKMKLPRHSLAVAAYAGESRVVNRGFYLTTDYSEFQTLLVQIQSLERAGELHYARQEHARAFRLIRAEPFKKMYDAWSEDQRRVILHQIETSIMRFVRQCKTTGEKETTRLLLEKLSALIPGAVAAHEFKEHVGE